MLKLIQTVLIISLTGILITLAGLPEQETKTDKETTLPRKIAGMNLEELRGDYSNRLFKQYLPFWEKGGYDKQLGGFMCELNDDGTVYNDEKFLWYQGRGLWVYSFLYSNFGKNPHHLEIATKTRDFMLKHMYAGGGKWYQLVDRKGKIKEGIGNSIYGWLFAAAGLFEYYKATGSEESLQLAKESVLTAVKLYDDSNYSGDVLVSGEVVKGLRVQGHAFMLVWTIGQLLSARGDLELERIQQQQINHIINDFWNNEYGIANEYLNHDYCRIPGWEIYMFPGHSVETYWMVMHEAIRTGDSKLFELCSKRIRRILEICWDYVYEGFASNEFYVFETSEYPQGPNYNIKSMWAHSEILIATMTIYEYTGAEWARQWYERTHEYVLKTMANTDNSVWQQAVDRFGNSLKRKEISEKRKGNFHQPRCIMLNLLSIEQLIKNDSTEIHFPSAQR